MAGTDEKLQVLPILRETPLASSFGVPAIIMLSYDLMGVSFLSLLLPLLRAILSHVFLVCLGHIVGLFNFYHLMIIIALICWAD